MKSSRAWMAAVAVVGAVSMGAGGDQMGSSRAGQLGPSGAAAGGTPRASLTGGNHAASGTGVVEATDERGGTVTISGDAYVVAPTTRFFDKTGESIPMQKLPVAREFRDEARVDTTAIVTFEAIETGRGWVLENVRVQGQLPR